MLTPAVAATTGPPIVVAEVSGNHQGSLETALEIVHMVARAGATMVKLQTYTPDSITLPVDSGPFVVSDSHALWGARTLYDLYQEAHTPYEWHEPIFALARELGLVPFSTPFDEDAVDFLEGLSTPLYKIASLEIVDLPLIRRAAETGKPLVISTGASSVAEVARAVETARAAGCNDLTLMLCTSSYPASPDDANLARIPILKALFGVKVGLSDHTVGTAVAVAAAALGASMIEKHVTLRRADGAIDSAFSLEEDELTTLVRDVATAQRAIGKPDAWKTPAEDDSFGFRPSLYVVRDVAKGELVTISNVRSVRPSGGLAPEAIDTVVGRRFRTDAPMGMPVTWDVLE